MPSIWTSESNRATGKRGDQPFEEVIS